MEMIRSARRRSLAAIGAGLLAPAGAFAQSGFPGREMRVVVPYPPGASTDNLSRAFARELSKAVGQPVIVENKPGGSTAIGTMAVRNAPADGHTLLLQSEAYWTAKLSTPGLGYEIGDLDVVAVLAQTPYALIVPARPGLTTIDDLKGIAARNGELTFGTLTAGTSLYSVLSARLAAHLGVPHRMIPYKGGVEGVSAVVAGEIDGFFATVALAQTARNSPKARMLGVTAERGASPFLPGVPAFADQGVKDMSFRVLFLLMARAGTPATVRARLDPLLRGVAESEEMSQARTSLSVEPFPGSVDDARAEMIRIVDSLRRADAAR